MVRFTVRLAEKVIAVEAQYKSTLDFCKDYLCTSDTPDISVFVAPQDVAYERRKSAEERALEGLAPFEFPKPYLETLALYRKIAEELVHHGIILFHGSALDMDGDGYIFTAKSGTGKSTHTRLWRAAFGSRVRMINDDKPLIIISDFEIRVCGTPWCGKHALGANISAPLKAISVLERSEINRIAPVKKTDALLQLLSQTYRPKSGDGMRAVMSLLDKLVSSVRIYRLGVNMEMDAAEVAYRGMNQK